MWSPTWSWSVSPLMTLPVSPVLRLALYAKWNGALGCVVMEPMLLNISDSRKLRGTGLHAMGRSFVEAVDDGFFWQSRLHKSLAESLLHAT